MRRMAQGTGISLLEGPVGELNRLLVCQDLHELWRQHLSPLGRGPFTGNSERWLKGGVGGSLSIYG
jgi:hypothetical protein